LGSTVVYKIKRSNITPGVGKIMGGAVTVSKNACENKPEQQTSLGKASEASSGL